MPEDSKVKQIKLTLREDQRICSCCNICLSNKESQLYIAVPKAKRAFEFCSWACLFKWVAQSLKERALRVKGRTTNELIELGYDFAGGSLPDRANEIDSFEKDSPESGQQA